MTAPTPPDRVSRQDDYRVVLVDDEVVHRGSLRPLPGQSDVSYGSSHRWHVSSPRMERLRATHM